MARIDRRSMLLATAFLALVPTACSEPAKKLAIKVYKDASCGCCTVWAELMTKAGFDVTIDESQDMAALKAKLGVPDDLASCHTAVINDYVIEGHVPADDIKQLLKKAPKANGLAVPGMPVNSPGMEVPGMADERYTVWLFEKDGKRTAFAEHGG